MKARFLEEAEGEMTSAAEFYEREVPDLGKTFLSEVRRAVELIERRPRIGSRDRRQR